MKNKITGACCSWKEAAEFLRFLAVRQKSQTSVAGEGCRATPDVELNMAIAGS
jgi:hypothetical protein